MLEQKNWTASKLIFRCTNARWTVGFA